MLWSFTQHNYFVIHPCWWYQYFITSYCQETVHCMDTSQYICPFTNSDACSQARLLHNAAIYEHVLSFLLGKRLDKWNSWHIW